MKEQKEQQDIRNMTAATVGKDLLSALVAEIKLLPNVWVKVPKKKQDDIIDRLRQRVEDNVKMAVYLIHSQGRTTVVGELDQITIKDGVKAVIKFGHGAENMSDLYDATGKSVLVVVSNAAEHTGGMDEIQGEADQRAMDLGHEYREDDGGGMDNKVEDMDIIEGETPALPSPEDMPPSEDERTEAWEAGYQAASDGKSKNDAPVIRHELVEEWLSGWSAWQEENEGGEK